MRHILIRKLFYSRLGRITPEIGLNSYRYFSTDAAGKLDNLKQCSTVEAAEINARAVLTASKTQAEAAVTAASINAKPHDQQASSILKAAELQANAITQQANAYLKAASEQSEATKEAALKHAEATTNAAKEEADATREQAKATFDTSHMQIKARYITFGITTAIALYGLYGIKNENDRLNNKLQQTDEDLKQAETERAYLDGENTILISFVKNIEKGYWGPKVRTEEYEQSLNDLREYRKMHRQQTFGLRK